MALTRLQLTRRHEKRNRLTLPIATDNLSPLTLVVY